MTELLIRSWNQIPRSLRFVAAIFGLGVCALYLTASETTGDGAEREADPNIDSAAYARKFAPDLEEDLAFDTDIDGDGVILEDEAIAASDPFVKDTDDDGFQDAHDDQPASRAIMYWGEPAFTDGNQYEYPRPDWLTSTFALGGSWDDLGWAHTPGSEPSGLCMEVDRTQVTGDVVAILQVFDSSMGSLYVDLYDENGEIVAEDLFGDLLGERDEEMLKRRVIPLSDYPAAIGILLRAEGLGVEIYNTTIFVDQDEDGFDAGQEAQLGTSDLVPNGRKARASRWTEKRLPKPERQPSDQTSSEGTLDMPFTWMGFPGVVGTMAMGGGGTDTDGDGLPDVWEVANGLNPSSGVFSSHIGWWKFDEGTGTNVSDSTTNGYDGIAFNISTSDWVTGKMGSALRFNGSNAYVSVVQSNAMISSTQFTITAWAKYDSSCTNHYATIINDLPLTNCPGVWLGYDNDDIPGVMDVYVAKCPSATYAKVTSDDVDFNDEWVHFATTYDGDTARIYANGLEVDADVGGFEGAALDSFGIGAWLDGGSTTSHWQGLIDDVRVYTNALTSNDIYQLIDAFHDPDGDGLDNTEEYAEGTDPNDEDTDGDLFRDDIEVAAGTDPLDASDYPGLDYGARLLLEMNEGTGSTAYDASTNDLDHTLKFSAAWNATTNEHGVTFNGVRSHLKGSNVVTSALTEYTFAFWMKPHLLGSSAHQNIGTKKNYGWLVFIEKDTDKMRLQVGNGSGWTGWSTDQTALQNTNDWIHIAARYKDGTVTFFQNGSATTTNAATREITGSGYATYIGNGGSSPNGPYDGDLHDFRIYEWALSDGLIYSVANRDMDNDGLGNILEHSLGTDWEDPDTDDDGILDGEEVVLTSDPFTVAVADTNGLVSLQVFTPLEE